ncbi:hypothetical protein HanHA300_Chr05g0182121 [Helianthus annuus]|nr:hypothetical protein HanHA300_Chr05g0182121 [Helianthus annuus]
MHVQFLLVEDVLEALMVGEDHTFSTIKVVSPNLQCKNDCTKFEVVGSIVFLMNFELSRCVSNNLVTLHKDTTKAKV